MACPLESNCYSTRSDLQLLSLIVIRPLARNEHPKRTLSIQTSDEGSSGLFIALRLTHVMPVQVKFYPSKVFVDGWLAWLWLNWLTEHYRKISDLWYNYVIIPRSTRVWISWRTKWRRKSAQPLAITWSTSSALLSPVTPSTTSGTSFCLWWVLQSTQH